jgi:hypothetical protein
MTPPTNNPTLSGGRAMGGYNPNAYDYFTNSNIQATEQDMLRAASTHNRATEHLSRMALGATLNLNSMSASEFMYHTNYSQAGMLARAGAAAAQNAFNITGAGRMADLQYGIMQGVGMGGGRLNIQGHGVSMTSAPSLASNAVSRMMFDRMQDHFFTSTGSQDTRRTRGMDATELGRAFNLLSREGMFAGKEVAYLGELSLTERLQNASSNLRGQGRGSEASMIDRLIRTSGGNNDTLARGVSSLRNQAQSQGLTAIDAELGVVQNSKVGMRVNPQVMDDVKKEVETFARFMEEIRDVMGDIDDVAAMSVGKTISGSNLGGQASSQMLSSLRSLKATAKAVGVGSEAFIQAEMANTQMYGSYFGGLSKFFSRSATANAFSASQASVANSALAQGRGQYAPVLSAEEIAQRTMQDDMLVANTRDSRRLLELSYGMVMDPKLQKDSRLQGILASMQNSTNASETNAALASLAQYEKDTGISFATNYKSNYLSDAIQNSPLGAGYADSIRRKQAQSTIRRRAQHLLGTEGRSTQGATTSQTSAEAASLFATMRTAFDQGTLSSLYDSLAKGDSKAVDDFFSNENNQAILGNLGLTGAQAKERILALGDSTVTGTLFGRANLAGTKAFGGVITEETALRTKASIAAGFAGAVGANLSDAQYKKSMAQVVFSSLGGAQKEFTDAQVVHHAVSRNKAQRMTFDQGNGSLTLTSEAIDALLKGDDPKTVAARETLKNLSGKKNEAGTMHGILSAAGVRIAATAKGNVFSAVSKDAAETSDREMREGAAREVLARMGLSESEINKNLEGYLSGDVKALQAVGQASLSQAKSQERGVLGSIGDFLLGSIGEQIKEADPRATHGSLAKNIEDALRDGNPIAAKAAMAQLQDYDEKTRNKAYHQVIRNQDIRKGVESATGKTISQDQIDKDSAFKATNEALRKIAEGKSSGGSESEGATQRIGRMQVDVLEVAHQKPK